jgi:hypothetical protein
MIVQLYEALLPRLARAVAAAGVVVLATGCGGRTSEPTAQPPLDAGSSTSGSVDAGPPESGTSSDGAVSPADASPASLPPWATGAVTLKLDPAGPVVDVPASPANDGVACQYGLGEPFGNFVATCVQPWGPSDPRSVAALSTLLGGITHGDEAYQLDAGGLALQVYATSLAPDEVITGADRPSSGDTLSALGVGPAAPAGIANDWQGNQLSSGVFDEHGSGMLYLEWANLVQRYLREHGDPPVTTDLGDPDCIANPVHGQTANGKVCSGIEGIITNAPLPYAVQTDPLGDAGTVSYPVNALGAGGVPGASRIDGALAQGFRPGIWSADFCSGTACSGGAMLGAMQSAVQRSFGNGPVPTPFGDPGFFFDAWVRALIRYLQSAGDATATLGTIDANEVNDSDLAFDTADGGVEQADYVFRNDVAPDMQPPTVLDVTANLTTSDIEGFTFDRYDFRGETLMYETQRTVPSDPVGVEPLYVSNLVGSPVLQSVFPSYACAIDPPSCDSSLPQPVQPSPYIGYEAAFGATAFHIAASGGPETPTLFTVDTEGPTGSYPAIQSAMITVPVFSNPFDLASPVTGQVSELLPYLTPAGGGGFPITIDGSRDRIYSANAIDFSGDSFSGTLYYDLDPAASDGGDEIFVRALQSQSYLGLVFACAAPSASQTPPSNSLLYGDILSVHMNQNAADIMTWITARPSAVASCAVEVKYGIYSETPEAISFLNTGVRFDLTAGVDGQVVSSVLLFDPNLFPMISQ